MADVANGKGSKPIAAPAATTTSATASAVVKPERPNEEEYKANLAKAEKELKAAEDKMKQIKAKLDNARPNNKDSPAGKRQAELRGELSTIRQQQASGKTNRTGIMDKIKRLDEQLKSRIAESKLARGKVNYKSAEDVQHEIDRLQKQVDSGSMKIVDEKKALGEISQLNRIKKSFAGFEESQKGIDEIKAQIAEQKKLLDDPESRALSDRYTQITTELDKIKGEQDEVFKNLNSLRDERTRLHEDQQKKYTAVKDIKDAYYSQRREAVKYEQEARRIREEKRRAENDAYHRGRRQEAAKAKLEEASGPAYQDEIRTTQSLLAYFDPSSAPKQAVAGPGKFAATNFRTVDDSGFKGTRVSKKDEDEENYFIGGGGKKNKRNRGQASGAGTSSTTAESKFNLDLGTIGSLAQIDVNPPMSQADVPALVEQLKEKLGFWKGDQERKTQENIAKAKADIERLEAEAVAAESKEAKPLSKSQENGTKDGTSAVTADLEKTKIEGSA